MANRRGEQTPARSQTGNIGAHQHTEQNIPELTPENFPTPVTSQARQHNRQPRPSHQQNATDEQQSRPQGYQASHPTPKISSRTTPQPNSTAAQTIQPQPQSQPQSQPQPQPKPQPPPKPQRPTMRPHPNSSQDTTKTLQNFLITITEVFCKIFELQLQQPSNVTTRDLIHSTIASTFPNLINKQMLLNSQTTQQEVMEQSEITITDLSTQPHTSVLAAYTSGTTPRRLTTTSVSPDAWPIHSHP